MDIGVPFQMTIKKNPHHLQITRTWFEMKYIFLSPVVISWDLFLFWGYSTIFSAPKVDMLAVLFLLLHLSLGVGLTYFLLAGFLNKTIIDVTSNVVSVRDSPLPAWGNKRIAAKDFLRLYCKTKKVRNGLYWIDIISVYAVVTNTQIDVELLSGLKSAEQAIFIQQEVEGFLNIENKLN